MFNKSGKTYRSLLSVASLLLPVVALAQGSIDRLVEPGGTFLRTLNLVIGILFVLATLIFLWGVIQFIAKSGDEQARTKAKGIMTWGIIGLAVMAAAWGVVNILVSYFIGGGSGSTRGVIPTLPGQIQN